MTGDVRLQILQLLKMRWDAPEGAKSNVVRLDELVEHFDLPKQEVRDHMTLLESRGDVKSDHSRPNPGYFITQRGQACVIEHS